MTMEMTLLNNVRKNNLFAVTLFLFLILVSCDTSTTSKGTDYRCVETSQTGSQRSYLVTLYKTKNNSTDYLISNFHRVGSDGNYDVTATISNSKITIQQQTLGETGSFIKSGTGTVNADLSTITINYNIVASNSVTTNYSAVYTR